MAGQHSDGDFAWKIANGRGPMPAWKSVLQENQIWDLVNFIQTLGDKKPDASHGKHEHGQHQH
jgi:mono/diheme cytochrome c family protein